jgi:endonuclease/exonuclease/phosphatase family metal-dependent hydrolase
MIVWGAIYSFFKNIKNAILFILFTAFSFSIAAHIVSPQTTILFAPFGLGFMPLLIATFIIGIIYLKRNKWIALAALLLVGLSFKFIAGSVALNFNQKKEGLKIMSWNVKNFDLYNWTKNEETRQNMFRLIDSIDPDVLCLQEFYTNKNQHDNLTALKKLGYKYYSFFPSYSQKAGGQWGLAIFSKTPLQKGQSLKLNEKKSSTNQCVSAQLSHNGQIYTIYNAHLQSIHLNYEDLAYIEGVKKEWSILDKLKSWRVIYKILTAYKSRGQQLELLLNKSTTSTNVILCCDLNDIPASHAYHVISQHYQDAFRKKGLGLSNTISIGLPIYRIDYIFSSANLSVNAYEKIENALSDHHIVVSYIE